MEVILLKTGKEYMDEWRKVIRPGAANIVYPSVWILAKWEEDNGFQGPWQAEEIKAWKDTILRDPVLADHLTTGYFIQSRTFGMMGENAGGLFNFLYDYMTPQDIKNTLDFLHAHGLPNIK